jgi:hypothetical protein
MKMPIRNCGRVISKVAVKTIKLVPRMKALQPARATPKASPAP